MKNTNINPITIILVFAFIYPLGKGFFQKFSSTNLKYEMEKVENTIIFILSLLLGIYFSKKIFFHQDNGIYKRIYEAIPHNITSYTDANPGIIFIVIMPIIIFILYKIFIYIMELLNKITLNPLLNGIETLLEHRSNLFKRISGLIFQLPKSICYVIFIAFVLNTLSIFNVSPSINKYLGQSKPYNYICKKIVIPITNSNVAKQLPNILNDSFKVVEKNAQTQNPNINEPSNAGNRTIIYYNGVTLDEGVRSNSEIDNFARKLVLGQNDNMTKANILYTWIGKNISYDNNKASSVLNNNFNIKSGAIQAYNTRKGICFDYACLYVAMCRANGFKVRLITGEGFNGVSWVSHAWNQVYLKGTWINVDTTFYNGGNYFNTWIFLRDHRDSKIAGQW